MKVDICSIMYNEELLLPLWIESWLSVPFINKIYLVDGGSTDRSLEIAKKYNRVQTMVVPWKNDFSRQRNIAIKMSKSNIRWIFQPDIDEIPCGNKFSKIMNVFEDLEKGTSNQLVIPYVKFYDWNTLWFFKNPNITPSFNQNMVNYAINKSTTTIFRKDHLLGYNKSLHEMPIYSGLERKNILSIKKLQNVSLENLSEDFFIGHYDQAKHFYQSKLLHLYFHLY